MPLVTVIIPSYNCALYIVETISSVLAQRFDGSLEVIVVDDGSTDATCSLARQFGGVVRVLEQTNGGVSSARNHGLREARGDFIALMDHDDYWFPDKLAHQLEAFASHPQVDVVFTECLRWHADDGHGGFRPPHCFAAQAEPQGIDAAFTGWIYHQMLLDSWVLTSTALARASVFERVGVFDESLPFSEDWDFWLRVSQSAQFLMLKESSTLYRQHPQQGSRMMRAIDYRTLLLERAEAQWGLQSADGRRLSARQFRHQLAYYSACFGLDHLSGRAGASRRIAALAFVKSLQKDWRYWRSLAYLALLPLGWRPRY